MSTSKEFRLHPWSIVLNLRGELKSLLFPAIIVTVAGKKTERRIIFQLVGFLVIGLIGALWRYFSLRLRFDDSEFVIRSGVFRRNERRIPYARIQSVDSTRNAIQQLLGVCEVVIHTAGSADPEAKLAVLPIGAVSEFRERIFDQSANASVSTRDKVVAAHVGDVPADFTPPSPGVEPTAPAQAVSATEAGRGDVLLRMSGRDLLIYGFIENRGMLLILGAIGLLFEYSPLEKMIGDAIDAEAGGRGPVIDFVTGLFTTEGHSSQTLLVAVGVIVMLLLFVRVASLLWAVVRLHDFAVTRIGDELRVEYGLFTKVSGTIPLSRIQTVSQRVGLVHRMFGVVTLDVTVARGGIVEKRALREPLAPILPAVRVASLASELWPDLVLHDATWQPLHPRAYLRVQRSGIASSVLISLALAPILRWWVLPVLFALALWKIATARRVVDSTNWTISEKLFAVRAGWIERRETIARVPKIQLLRIRESYFDRRNAMAGVLAHTGGGIVDVLLLPAETARTIFNSLSNAAANTKFRL